MKKLTVLAILLICGFRVFAQDPQFSQFYASPLYLGPSMAGASNGTRFCLNYRDQWPGISGRYRTYAISADQYFSKYNSGIGVLFLTDNEGKGKLKTTQAGINYSYRIPVTNDFFIQPGLQTMYFERKVNFNLLTFADQYYGTQVLTSTVEDLPDQNGGHLDFSSSILGFTKWMWIGFTLDHMMRMSTTLSDNQDYVPVKFSSYGGFKIPLVEKLLSKDEQSILVAFNYRNQAKMNQLDMGMYYNRYLLAVGVWYRGIPVIKNSQSNDALAVSFGISFPKFTFAYSYDLTVSSLITSTGGAHELSLIYKIDDRGASRGKRRWGAVPCPKF